jgi:hypothetical protein
MYDTRSGASAGDSPAATTATDIATPEPMPTVVPEPMPTVVPEPMPTIEPVPHQVSVFSLLEFCQQMILHLPSRRKSFQH